MSKRKVTPRQKFIDVVSKWSLEQIEDALRPTFVYYAPERAIIKRELAKRKAAPAPKALVPVAETANKVAVIACGGGLANLAAMFGAITGVPMVRAIEAAGDPAAEQEILNEISENARKSARRIF